MADFLKILESKIDFSPTEAGVAERWFRQVERDSLFANAISSSGGGGGVTSVDAGNVAIDLSEGLTIKNPDTGDTTIRFDSDGDAWFGSNIDYADYTTMFIISNEQVYNTETMGEGDLLIGSNSAGKGNMWWDASTGKLYFRSGTKPSVEIGDGGIIATWGKIGGWNIGSDSLYDDDSDIVLDSAAGTIKVGSGSDYIFIDGASKLMKSSNFYPGAAGWIIEETGDAEFNNITARGTFKTSVFLKDNMIATGGTIRISKNAGVIHKDVTCPASGTFALELEDDDSDFPVAEVDDLLQVKGWNGTDIVQIFATVNVVDNLTGYSSYTVYLHVGANEVLQKGMACINLGPDHAGTIELTAGVTTTYMAIWERDLGSGVLNTIERLRLGNMRNTYGTGSNDRYGIGVGDFSSGNYLSYNAETPDTFVISAGDGHIIIDESGIKIDAYTAGSWQEEYGIHWNNEDPYDPQYAQMYSYSTSTNNSLVLKCSEFFTGSRDASLLLNASAGASVGKLRLDANYAAGTRRARMDMIADNSAVTSYIEITTDDEVRFGKWAGLPSAHTTMATISTVTGVGVFGDGNAYCALAIRGTTSDLVFHSGTSGISGIFRGESSGDITWKRYNPVGTYSSTGLTFDSGTGDIYTVANTDYSGSSYITGWGSYVVKMIRYRSVGKMIHVWFFIEGTSNLATTTFSLPANAVNHTNLHNYQVVQVKNGGVYGVGVVNLPPGSNVVLCYSNVAHGAWATTGVKRVIGHFSYQVA